MRQSISSVFTDRATADPDEPIVIDRAGAVTAGELDRAANRLAWALMSVGTGRDDTVMIALPNDRLFVVACVAVWRVGATPMPMAPDMPDAERLHLEQLARPAAAIGVPPRDRSVPHLTGLDAGAFSEEPLPDAWATCWKAPVSSGSTGIPKVVRASAPALVDPTVAVAEFLPRNMIQLVTAPLWHSAAFTYAFRGLTSGHRLVVEAGFDERRFGELVEAHRVTWALLSPAAIRRLVRLDETERSRHDVSGLHTVLHLGARCPGGDKRALLDWLGPDRVVEVYAGSESNGLTMITGREWYDKPGSVGRPTGGTRITIRRPDGTDCDTGEPGEIWMHRGERPAYAYLGSDSRRTDDGWDTLGDIGFLDADGYLFVLDRRVDIVVIDNEVIYPADIEEILETHPQVRGAVAFGEDTADGPRISIAADIGETGTTTAQLLEFAAEHLPRGARPHRIILTTTPLRNDAGKVRRHAMSDCPAHSHPGQPELNGDSR